VLAEQLGEGRLAQLDVQPHPIGAASLGQVHRARRKLDGRELCLKIQYPGVGNAIDSDIDAVATLLKLARIVRVGPAFDEWLDEVRHMMHREVNYTLELETTRRFGDMLRTDSRFVVPEVFPEFSTRTVMATSFEPGLSVNDPSVLGMPQGARNELAVAALELFLHELFDWAELQTDPNFGNYRIRHDERGLKLVLLDFGAVQKYPAKFIEPVCGMIKAAYERDLALVITDAIRLKFMRPEWPDKVLNEFGEVCIAVLEPLAKERPDLPPQALNELGHYRWKYSDLPTRIAKRAAKSAFNRYFQIPPKEFVFLNRKLVGVYTFISVLDAEFNGAPILERFLYRKKQ
jgi:predicted unusual protein kinase regulating ubiquinone biosynthesis (AarF/ABC1/UbiB family)